mgnify:FL=1
MKNIIQIIKDAGLEVTDEQKKTIEDAVKENYKSVSDYEKQTRKVETLTQESNNWKTQYDEAKKTLDGFEGKDFDAITRERDEWKTKAENAEKEWKDKLEANEKEYKQKIEERDFNDVLAKALSDEKFSSEFAKTGIINMIKEKGLKREGEKILGLEDYLTELKESQKDAFVADGKTPPVFTTPTNKGGGEQKAEPFVPKSVW